MNFGNLSWIIRSALALLAFGLIDPTNAAFAHGARHNPTRYHYLMANGIPSEYEGLVNQFPMTNENLAAGARLYKDNCAVCHGAKGNGRGEAAEGLKPPPAVLTGMYDRPMMGMGKGSAGGHFMHGMMHHHPGMSHAEAMGGLNLDAYNFWATSEGGDPIGSAMPAFKEALTKEERWQVLLYIANGLNAEKR